MVDAELVGSVALVDAAADVAAPEYDALEVIGGLEAAPLDVAVLDAA